MTVLDNTKAPPHTTPDDTLQHVAGVDVAHFYAKVILDALQEATADYWNRRADTLDKARPRPGDRPGPNSDLIDRRCTDAAQACRNRATLTRTGAPTT